MRSLDEIRTDLQNRAQILGIEGVVVDSLIDLLAYYAYTNEIAYSKLVRESDFATASENGRIMLSAGFMDTYSRGDLDYIDCEIAVTIGKRSLNANDLVFSIGKVNYYTKEPIKLTTVPTSHRFYASKNYKTVQLHIDVMTDNAYIDVLDKFNWSNDVLINGNKPSSIFDDYLNGGDSFVLTLADYDLRIYSKTQDLILSGYQYYKLTDDDIAQLSKVKVQGLVIEHISITRTAGRPNYSGESYDITNKILFKSNKDLVKGVMDLGVKDANLSLVNAYPCINCYTDMTSFTSLYKWIADHEPYFINPIGRIKTADIVNNCVVIPELNVQIPLAINDGSMVDVYRASVSDTGNTITLMSDNLEICRINKSTSVYEMIPKISIRRVAEKTIYLQANIAPIELIGKVGLKINISDLIRSYIQNNTVLYIHSASYTSGGPNIIDEENILSIGSDEVITNLVLV